MGKEHMAMEVLENAALAPLTRYRVGGTCRRLYRVRSQEDVVTAILDARDRGLPCRFMGGGSNLLIDDGAHEIAVLRPARGPLTQVEVRDDYLWVGAGASFGGSIRRMIDLGMAGGEGLSGIPGTIGGALIMNAGGHYGEIKDIVQWVEVVDRQGQKIKLSPTECGFRYRDSDLGDFFITGCALSGPQGDSEKLKQRFKEVLDRKRKVQPLNAHSAGCVFKNIDGQSTGRLMDELGMKNWSQGGAKVSEIHANFLLTDGACQSSDLIGLIKRCQSSLEAHLQQNLEWEIHYWPRQKEL